MNILVINGSPRGKHGNTEILVRAFLEGATSRGAEAETIYLNDLKIGHCTGCYTCWTRTPGVCAQKDDMAGLLAKVWDADLRVWATPLYHYTVSGLMKDFMDRQLPLAHPFIVKRGEHYAHPAQHPDGRTRQLALISNCGFPEVHHFDGLKATAQLSAGGRPLAATICCAGGPMLRAAPAVIRWYLDAVREAGRCVAEGWPVSAETQAILDRPLIADPGVYAEHVNQMWKSTGVEPPVGLTVS
jgi:putative NADPH-quinone reductase